MSPLPRRLLLGLSGGIAAYKSLELARELIRRGHEVRAVMTPSAARFVGPVTFTGLTGSPAVVDLWDPTYAGEIHVELGRWADAMVIAPATMNTLGKLAHGLVDDAVTACAACLRGPLVVAPAMHTRMWQRPSTQRNVEALRGDGVQVVGPVVGPLASGESGEGRMAEITDIADALLAALTPQDLAGLRLLVTAGPTVEDLDPVRFLGNRSTGKMGFAIARRALARGARVTLVRGPVELPDPPGAEVVRVRSALEMQAAVTAALPAHDALVMSAAVADYRAKHVSDVKVKKGDDVSIELVRNPDILLEVGAARTGPLPVLVGFALETHDVVAYARDKLFRKRVDMIVANEARVGFGGDDNEAVLVRHDGETPTGRVSKLGLADRILDGVREFHARATSRVG